MTSGPHWSAAGECVNWSRETGRAGRTGSREMGLARAGLGSGAVEWAARRGVWLGRDDRAARAEEGSAGWARVGRERAARFGLGRRKVASGLGCPRSLGWFLVLVFLSISPFLILFQTQAKRIQINLNSNSNQTTKEKMLQHECNNKV